MIALICTQCHGKLEITDDSKAFVSDGIAIVRARQSIKCPYCGTEYLPGDEMQAGGGDTVIVGDGNVVGGNNVVAFQQDGQKVNCQINMTADRVDGVLVGAQIGAIGDNIQINGIHFGRK
jgi:hypothetical protein